MRVRLTKRASSNREIGSFSPQKKNLKVISKILRSTAVGLGLVNSAASKFNQLKSAEISPDGKLGGKGFVREITAIRKAYFDVCDKLSDIYDCLYDECKAPHWKDEEVIEKVDEVQEFVKEEDQSEFLIDQINRKMHPDKYEEEDDDEEEKESSDQNKKLEPHIG